MKLFDFFKKKPWKQKNAATRAGAVDALDDQIVLEELAKNDPDKNVREKAVIKLTS